MKNIDDTRTVYDNIVVKPVGNCGWYCVFWGNQDIYLAVDKPKAEKFRSDLIRFVENYK